MIVETRHLMLSSSIRPEVIGREIAAFRYKGEQLMRMKSLIFASLLVATAACKQETASQTTVDPNGDVQSSTSSSTTVAGIDSTDTANAAQATREAGADVAAAGRDAAHATGTAMESAGKSIQKHSKPGNQP